MKSILRRFLPSIVWILVPFFVLAGCAADAGSGTTTSGVTSVTISGNSSVEVESTLTLTATPNATPDSATYTWTVTDSGNYVTYTTSTTSTLTLTGKAAGTVTVKVSVDGVTSAEKAITVTASSSSSSSSTSTITLTFLNGDEDLKVSCEETSSGYTFTATPPDSTGTFTYAWYLNETALDSNSETCTVSSSEVSSGSKIFVTAVDSALPDVIYSAEYGF